MDIKFQKPKIEPKFQAEIYRAKQGSDEVYRVVIGREGTEVPPKAGEFVDYHEISDFLGMNEIEAWVNGQVFALEKQGRRVEFDESPSYQMSRALNDLASESQKPRVRILFQKYWLN